MAKNKTYKGITLKFGADTKELGTALNSVESKIKNIDKEMKAVNESLKLNPDSSIAKNQQFELLSKSIEATAEKLKELENVQEEVEKEFADGNIGEEAYRSFQRELENTRARLKSLQDEQNGLTQTTDNLDEATNSAENLSNELENARKEGIKKFSDSVGTLKTEVKDTVDDIVELGTKAIAAIATATTAALAGATKVGMDFEAAMSQVVATMGIDKTTEEFYKLENIAKEMGATTKYTATEAAEALNYLALAGYNAEKQIKTLPTVLNLATAGGMELAYSSDMVTDAMSALGISADNVSTFADKLAKTAQKSNTSVSQLGEAILTIGGTAKQLKGGVTELNTALGILADNGIKGEEGGTQLRNILNDLTDPTTDATKALKAMNVEIYDSTTGGLRSLADIFSDINSYLQQFGDNDEAINSMLNPIFDVRNMKGVQALLANSGERFQELSFYINDSEGAAKKMADTMADNLSGSLTILKSGLEACGLTIYENIEEPFKMAVNTAIEEVTKLNQSMESGDLQVSIQKIAEGFSELLETVVDLVVDDGIPAVIDALEWISKNGALIKSTLFGIGAGFLTFKVGSIIMSTVTAFQSLTTAVKAGATAMELFNTVSNKNPYLLITTAVLTTVPAIISYINATNEAKDVTKSYREELEKTKKSADEMRLSSETEISLIERKVGRYEYLRKALGENASQSREFTVLAEELQEMLGNSVEVIDSVTGAYNDLSQSAQIAIKNMRAEAEFNARKSVYEAEIAQLVELKDKQAQARTEYSKLMQSYRDEGLTNADIEERNLDDRAKDNLGLEAYSEQILLIEAEISEFESYAESYYANIEDVMQQTNETAVESAEIVVKPAEALNSALKTVNESIQSYHDSVNSLKSANNMLSSAFQEQTENGKLSVDTIMSLIDNGYSLALQWDNETGSCTLLKDKVTELTSAKYAQIKADLRLQYIDLKQKYDEEAKALENLEGKINSVADAQLYMTRIKALESSETELSNMESYMNMLDNMLKDTETIDKVVEVETVAEDVTDPRIEALKKEKEIVEAIQKARQQELDIKKAMIELENAQNQKNQRVYYEEKGWVWEADKKAINEKTENLNKLLADRQISSLDNQINGIDISSYANDFQSIVNSFSSLSSHFNEFGKNIGDSISNTSNNNSVTINVENINTDNPVDFLGKLNKVMNDANMKMILEE